MTMLNKKNFFQVEMSRLIIDKLKTNLYIIIIFLMSGILLASLSLDFDKESINSLFSTIATITIALIGFVGIFFVFLLQNNRTMILYYFADVNRLKDKLKIYPISIKEADPEKINLELDLIKHHIECLDFEIKAHDEERRVLDAKVLALKIEERKTLNEAKYILNDLILEHVKLEQDFSPYRKSFLFSIFGVFLFMIPLAFNHVNFSNDSYVPFFDYWIFLKMPFAMFLFGLFFIILKDSAIILKDIFDKISILKPYPPA